MVLKTEESGWRQDVLQSKSVAYRDLPGMCSKVRVLPTETYTRLH
jgi:hypothetical protein